MRWLAFLVLILNQLYWQVNRVRIILSMFWHSTHINLYRRLSLHRHLIRLTFNLLYFLFIVYYIMIILIMSLLGLIFPLFFYIWHLFLLIRSNSMVMYLPAVPVMSWKYAFSSLIIRIIGIFAGFVVLIAWHCFNCQF